MRACVCPSLWLCACVRACVFCLPFCLCARVRVCLMGGWVGGAGGIVRACVCACVRVCAGRGRGVNGKVQREAGAMRRRFGGKDLMNTQH